jgi:predicted nuclease of predicted toxin-antitoxin system
VLFKLDENLPAEARAILRDAGHDALSVTDQGLGGAPDTSVDQVCQEEDRLLVTLDLDFSDIRAYPPSASAGRIVLRLPSQDKNRILALLSKLCSTL